MDDNKQEETGENTKTLTGVELICTTSFHHDRCVICQKSDNKHESKKASEGTIEGVASLKRAANAKEDVVVKKRILTLEENKKPLLYHNTYECYKKYTKNPSIQRLEEGGNEEPTEDALSSNVQSSTQMLRRSSVQPREKPLEKKREEVNSKTLKCTICGSVRVWDKRSKKHVREKYRISEPDVAQSFIDATRHFKDEVYSRTADLTSQKLVTAADLFYHRHCLRTYTGRYERERSSKSEVAKPKPVNRKEELFHLALKELDQRINEGMGFTMTEIREYICSLNKDPEPVILYNRDVKKLLQDHYGGKIQLALNPQKN